MRFIAAFPIVLLLALPLLASPAAALRLTDNLHFTISTDQRTCIDILLPDDAGTTALAKASYSVFSDAPWGDLKEGATFETDENNTALIPLCFSAVNIPQGNCSLHTITVRPLQPSPPAGGGSSLGAGKIYKGGACVSRLADVDVALLPANPTNSSVAALLNRNADVFALGFREPLLTVTPGAAVNLTLLLESTASAEHTIDIETTLSLPTTSFSAATNATSQKREFPLTTVAPTAPGDYAIKATARRPCSQPFCTKTAQATVRVVASAAELPKTFSLTLFPERLDLASIGPAFFELTIRSPTALTAELSLALPPGLTSTFTPTSVTLGAGDAKTLSFLVTPAQAKQLYELTATAAAGNQRRTATATLSTQELATDAQRAISALPPAAQPEANSAYETWYADYSADPAATGDLAALQARIAAANATQPSPPAPAPTPTPQPAPAPAPAQQNPLLYIIPVVIVALVVAWLVVRTKLKKKPAARKDPFRDFSG